MASDRESVINHIRLELLTWSEIRWKCWSKQKLLHKKLHLKIIYQRSKNLSTDKKIRHHVIGRNTPPPPLLHKNEKKKKKNQELNFYTINIISDYQVDFLSFWSNGFASRPRFASSISRFWNCCREKAL